MAFGSGIRRQVTGRATLRQPLPFAELATMSGTNRPFAHIRPA